MSRATGIKEYRERRKPFPHTISTGETFLLRALSITSLLAAGSMPSELTQAAVKLATKSAGKKEITENISKYVAVVEEVVIHGVVEPRIVKGEGTADALSISEIDDNIKFDLFNAIINSAMKLFEGKMEINLHPFPQEPGGGAAGASGEILEPETVGDGGDSAGPSESA